MKKFIVERDIPGLGKMSKEELQTITQKSNDVLKDMKVPYHWLHSYITGDKMYCIHIAPDEKSVREHARRGGFPIDHIFEITDIIDPTTTDHYK